MIADGAMVFLSPENVNNKRACRTEGHRMSRRSPQASPRKARIRQGGFVTFSFWLALNPVRV